MKLALIVVVVVGAVLLAIELALRHLFGFGDPLLYRADPQIGYLLAPNQSVKRYGNRIAINQFSMRSPDLAATRAPDTLRILLLGDSIANGGWWTDQPNTISEMIRQQMARSLPATLSQVEVLNASANSWSPRNELAYLQRFGRFEAQVTVLLINTDDLFGTAPTSLPVGRDRNYPDRKPGSAMAEVLTRYLVKPSPIPELEALQAEKGDRVGIILQAIQQIQAIAQQDQGVFLLVMTPLLRELGQPGPRDYEVKARQRLVEFAQAEGIVYIDVLPLFNAAPNPAEFYRDHIHLTPLGNQQVTQQVVAALAPRLTP